MRFPRPEIRDCCVHVTHRCQQRRFLLDTDIDRKQYVKRLWEASRQFRTVRVLDYVVTSNHVHLLAWVPRMGDLSRMMRWLQGTFASDYNRRRRREGAFWRGRFHATLVQTGNHLSRCLFYVDMNMVRAGVVEHPEAWRFGGYQQLSGARKRYCIIDFERLVWCLGLADARAFGDWYAATLDELCLQKEWRREPYWSESFAVGDRSWLRELTGGDSETERHITPVSLEGTEAGDLGEDMCTLNPPRSLYYRVWRSIAARTSR